MKRTKGVLCLVACLILASGCDSAVSKLSTAIRHGWERLNGKVPAPDPEPSDFTEVESVPGPALNNREKEIITKAEAVRKIAAEPTDATNEEAHEAAIIAARISLDRMYPPAKLPINRADMLKAMKALFPNRFGDYAIEEQSVVGQGKGSESEEELIPGLMFPTNSSYLVGTGNYKKTSDKRMILVLADRGNLPEWVRTAHWYYARKGAVGKDEQSRMRFLNTMERNGKTWVLWESKETKMKFIMNWHGRWQVYIYWVNNVDDADALFSSPWIEKNM